MILSSFLAKEQDKTYYKKLMKELEYEYKNYTVYPKYDDLFTPFVLCDSPKVVILGQDPYIHYGQAHGIAFSVYDSKITPSLRNIFKELKDDLNIERTNCNLSSWCKQGVLLFNTIFTVRENESLSHKDIGWQTFSENLVKFLDSNYNLVFILWGSHARKFKKFICNGVIIEGVHPSPLSAYRGFFGSKPFSRCNELLKELGKEEIQW